MTFIRVCAPLLVTAVAAVGWQMSRNSRELARLTAAMSTELRRSREAHNTGNNLIRRVMHEESAAQRQMFQELAQTERACDCGRNS